MEMQEIQTGSEKRFERLLTIAETIRGSNSNAGRDLPSLSSLRVLLLENLIDEVDGVSGSIMLHDAKTGALTIATALGIDDAIVGATEIKPGSNTVSRYVFDNSSPLYVSDTIKSQLKPHLYDPRSSGSFMSMPLNTIGGASGVVNINAGPGKQFGNGDLSYGILLSTYIAALTDKYKAIGMSNRAEIDQQVYDNSVAGFVQALRAKGEWLYSHSMGVQHYSLAIADAMCAEGMGVKRRSLKIASGLHDLGKIGVADEIVDKPEKLTAEEYALMQRHPVISKLAVSIIDPNGVSEGVLRHHNYWEPTGKDDPASYPNDGIYGPKISLMSRIIAGADTIDAMRSERPYRKSLPWEVVMAELNRVSGTQLDPRVVQAANEAYRSGRFTQPRVLQ